MRRRHLLWLVLLISAAACQDAPPLTPPVPDEPRFAVTGGSGGWDLRSGYAFVCALRSGRISCFGEHDDGQPIGGHGAATGSFVQMDAGATHVCGLRSDGAVECFGSNEHGQAPPLRRAATGSFTSVSGGLAHSCAVRSDGIVECWGHNVYGQAPGVKAPATGRFTEVNASAHTSCGLRSDGVIECWGHRGNGAAPAARTAPSGTYAHLADGIATTNCALTTTGVADCWGYLARWDAGPFVQVVVGSSHHCALRTNGAAECWGYPGYFEGPGERTFTGHSAVNERTWSRISAGSYHACGLRGDGYFECFGAQTIGSDAPSVVPVADPPRSYLANWRVRTDWRDVNSNDQRTEIERAVEDNLGNQGSFTRVGAVGVNRVSFVDSLAKAGAAYVYRIRVCNNAGCSDWKVSDATRFPTSVPPQPAAATSGYVCGYNSCARVTWSVDNTFVETFRIQRRVYGGGAWGAWQNLPQQDRSATSYSDYGITPGGRYQYQVRACNARGCSAHGVANPIVAPTVPPPNAPADLSAGAMGNYMYVAWGDVATETYYELQRRQHDGTAWGAWSGLNGGGMNDTRYEDPVVPGTLYQYRIRACNQGGCSAYTYSAETRA